LCKKRAAAEHTGSGKAFGQETASVEFAVHDNLRQVVARAARRSPFR